MNNNALISLSYVKEKTWLKDKSY